METPVSAPVFRRKNGLTCPLDVYQVLTWALVALSLCYFVGVSYTFLPPRDALFWLVLYLACWSAGIALFAVATFTEHQLPASYAPDHMRHCQFCCEPAPDRAKHCRACNRCRLGFDHHCRFINNCVTASNYAAFFYGCLCLLAAWYLAVAYHVRAALAFRGREDAVLRRLAARFGRASEPAFWALLAAGLAINCGVGAPMTVLVAYHTFFQRICVSTWDYIKDRFPNAAQNLQRFWCPCQPAHVRVGA
jgi:palmitoyltransferase